MASRRPTFIWVSSNGESMPGRTAAARQRTASAPYLSRTSVGTTTLPLDFDIFLRSGSRIQPGQHRVRPRGRVVLVVRPDHAGEQPGADDLVGLRAQVHREDPPEQVVVDAPAAGDLRGQRRGGPGVHDVRVAEEAVRLAALVLGVAARGVGRRVDRQLRLGRQQRVGVVGLALAVERVPDRERDAEEPLARDEPVAGESGDPVVVADLHVRREPGDLGAVLEHLGADVVVAAAVADVPLPGRDDLERLVAPLVEVRHPRGRLSARRRGRRSHEAPRPSPRARRTIVLPASRSYAGGRGLCRRARPASRGRGGRRGRSPCGPAGSARATSWTSVRSPKVQHMAMPAPLSISARWWATTGISTPKTGDVTVVPNSGW